MRLADFIVDQPEAILQEWDEFARTKEPASQLMTSKELRDHAAEILKSIASNMCIPQTSQEQVAKSHGEGRPKEGEGPAREHGIVRLESRFTIEQLVSEYRALRASVLRLWIKSSELPQSSDLDDITRFNEAIDELLIASVSSFAEIARETANTEQRRRDEFLAMLAHELRNPLAPISSAAALLEMARGNESLISHAGKIIARQVGHMTNLVDDLLDVSRVTRGLIALKQEALDVRRIIADAVEQATPLVQARHQQLTVTEQPGTANVSGDYKRLVQVITNLLSNAVKFTPEQGHIELQMEVCNGQVVIAVHDNGIGMTPEFVPHAFDLFAQAERPSDRTSGGLGLGLALVKNLVELHGGKVACSSPGPNLGSRFTVCLPLLLKSENRAERRRTPRDQSVSGQLLKILVVDDNVDAAQTLALLLHTAGHQVMVEYASKRALDSARTGRPDVCLLDIGLPEMDGHELARRLRSQPETAGTFLIALTGYGQAHDREQAFAAGFNEHMTKPVDLPKLLSLLAAIPAAGRD